MTTIHNSNLLYRPSLSVWTARKKDKSKSAEVARDAGAVHGATNVYKALLPEFKELEAIERFASAFRQFIYDRTLPWDDAGWRIGQVAKHMEFMAQVGDKLREFDALVDAFMVAYGGAVENARFQLNDLFSVGDYPGSDEVRAKFRASVDVQTLPNVDDFRVLDGVPQDEVDKLVGVAKNSVESRVQAAMETAYERLYEAVAKMATTLDAFGKKEVRSFHDTLVGNIADLVEVMPALNITGDAKLAELATKARELTMYAAVDLRKDNDVRTAAIAEAKALAAEIKGTTEQEEADHQHIAALEAGSATLVPRPEDGPINRALFADMLGA